MSKVFGANLLTGDPGWKN